MKKIILLLLLSFVSISITAQEKITDITYETISNKVVDLVEKEKYQEVIEAYNTISVNDSSYGDALISKSYYLLELKKYEEAIKETDKGLKKVKGEFRYGLYLNKGVAYESLENYKECIETYNQALKEFPKHFQLYYNRGVAFEKQKDYKNAISDFKQSIILNPYYAQSHLQLGSICYKEKKMTQALMALNMYLVLDPDGKNSLTVLSSINTSFSRANDSKPTGIQISKDDASFEDIDLILSNRIALNKGYKIKNKIDLPMVKQNHVLFEQLKDYEGGNDGFWDQKYVPFYKWMIANDLFDSFVYTTMYSLEKSTYKKIVDKNTSKVRAFIRDGFTKWITLVGENNDMLFRGKQQKVSCMYEDKKLLAIGLRKEGKEIGIWEVFDDHGKLNAEGAFDNEGKKTGEWKWFNKEGKLNHTINYLHDELEGKYTSYYKTGGVDFEYVNKKGKVDGVYRDYNEYGALIEVKNFIDGDLQGEYKSYYNIGKEAKEYVGTYKNGQFSGELINYYDNGQVWNKVSYVDGKFHGDKELYHNNGELKAKYTYNLGKLSGKYEEYYDDGVLEEEGQFINDMYEGLWKLYFMDGTLYREMNYSKDLLNGEYKEYDIDGKLHYTFIYKKGELVATTHFDKDGNSIHEVKKKSGNINYEGYSPVGVKETKGLYNIKGGKEGVWEYYDYGVKTSYGTYKDNQIEGEYFMFYNNGKKRIEKNYENDKLNGYFVSYHKNGKISEQGYYNRGLVVGQWKSYYLDGTLKRDYFYHKDEKHGIQKEYATDGKLYEVSKYEFGRLISRTYYTSSGSIHETIDNTDFSNKSLTTFTHLNGKPFTVTNYLGGQRHGSYKKYYFEGQLSEEGTYFNGKQKGKWQGYHENGKLKWEGIYVQGKAEGEWKYYFKDGALEEIRSYRAGKQTGTTKEFYEDGTLQRENTYKNGKPNGMRKFYSPTGKLQFVRYYNNGNLIGYSYNNKKGELKPMIPLKSGTGNLLAYFDNGIKSAEMQFENGYFINDYKTYTYQGKIYKEMSHIMNENHGTYKLFYANGTAKAKYNYNYGDLNGESLEYYANGKLKEKLNYKNDILHGEAFYYNKNGTLIEQRVYFNGLIEKQTKY
ncbi:toxin-antitoxin system YwqK family antitoxin [Aquimarina agarilytica]|uniref:toxin-antitoxin system YwqK family antitoxin n=1 Tax=Aquimarina agarilytica TaxID=1087449 RepID=UPI0002895E86|nr:toxin-antitoxin system YwqK family antitoxin [Aquimarina agarilytica]